MSDNGIVPPALLRSIIRDDALLNRNVPGLLLDNSDLNGALQRLADASHIRIQARWDALEGAGIDRYAPVHVHLTHGSLREWLRWIGDDVGQGTTRLNYSITDETITFSTAEDIAKDTTTEIYNIRPLIEQIKSRLPPAPSADGIVSVEPVDYLIDLVISIAAPDVWRSVGGTAGDLREVGGLLVVTLPRQAHREVATLLTRLDAEFKK